MQLVVGGFSQLSEHIGTVLPPSDLRRVKDSDLTEESIDISVGDAQVHIHKFVTVGEFRVEVTKEETLDLRLALAGDPL